VCASGVGVFGCAWILRDPIMRLLAGVDFLPAAPLFPVLVASKFVAIATGIVIWALLAGNRDWLPAMCCAPVLVGGFVLNRWLIPRYGTEIAAWLVLGMEMALLVLCLTVFVRVEKRTLCAK
ncbi:MAG: hypothetical protein N3G20_11930, partial [Verrucomicrobiae bacterium]|nr:hypothetical protein [Verrucomicrobiae bacterium]